MPSYVRAGIRKCARIRALSTETEFMQTKRRKPPHYKGGTKIRPYQFAAHSALVMSLQLSDCKDITNSHL